MKNAEPKLLCEIFSFNPSIFWLLAEIVQLIRIVPNVDQDRVLCRKKTCLKFLSRITLIMHSSSEIPRICEKEVLVDWGNCTPNEQIAASSEGFHHSKMAKATYHQVQ